MKIVVTAQGKKSSDLMDPRFGRCQYFYLYDTDNNLEKVIENLANKVMGGAGIKAANLLLKEKIDVIITGDLGPNARQVLKNNQVKVFTSEVKKVSEIIDDYQNKKLKETKF